MWKFNFHSQRYFDKFISPKTKEDSNKFRARFDKTKDIMLKLTEETMEDMLEMKLKSSTINIL